MTTTIAILFSVSIMAPQQAAAEDLDALQEKAMKTAVARVAPSVVQIATTGGTDLIGSGGAGTQIRKGVGPTTGLVVSADGHIVTSTFNFANKPSAIFVTVPGQQERFVAKIIANDQTRMLTLLKIEANNLPVPTAAPKGEMRVGQWTVAVGRTMSSPDGYPSVSAGIVSALGRIWGKAIQTDAKVSPLNYGGPLVDLQGRVLGVLVPVSPRGQDETAGVEWYDAGIGFAIPLEDVNAVLPRFKEGKDLKRGLLGVRFQSADVIGTAATVGIVAPDSTATRAGIKPGDTIIEVNGVAVTRQAQLMHLLGNKYDGDVVSIKVQRDKDVIDLPNLKLSGESTSHIHPLLGILPVRDDPEPGEEVRFVFPQSPADAAGLKPGDRIMTVALGEGRPHPFSGPDDLIQILDQVPPGAELKLEVQRKEGMKTETLSVRLGVMNDVVPDKLPEPATRKQALTPRKTVRQKLPMIPLVPGKEPDKLPRPIPQKKQEEKKDEPKKDDKKPPETGTLHRTNAAGDREYWVHVPEDYDANIPYALVLWLHPVGKGTEKDFEALVEAWKDACKERHLILVGPKAESETGWLASETEGVLQIVRDVLDQYTIDRRRVVAHGMGLGGQFAFYLGFNARDLIRGVATTGAVFTGQPKDNVADQRLAFFLVAGGKDPLQPAIAESKAKLAEQKFPVVYREIAEMGHRYLDVDRLEELVRWIDSLDRH